MELAFHQHFLNFEKFFKMLSVFSSRHFPLQYFISSFNLLGFFPCKK